jgi:flagellar motility protein MotE (MotC chaperone)
MFAVQNKALKEATTKDKFDAQKFDYEGKSNIVQVPIGSSRQLLNSKADTSSKENNTSNSQNTHEIDVTRSDILSRRGVANNSIQFSRRGKQSEPEHYPGPSPRGPEVNENVSTPATPGRLPDHNASQRAGLLTSMVDTSSSTEKRAAEGGLTAALKKSRSVYDELVSRRDVMVEKFRMHQRECQHLDDLTCTTKSKKDVRRALDSEREQEIHNLSERIRACIEKSSKAMLDFLDQQEDAEHSLLRVNAAILNRLNNPRAAVSKVEKRCVCAFVQIPCYICLCALYRAV